MHYIKDSSDTASFWDSRMDMVIDKMLPLQLAILEDRERDAEPSHAIENFKIAAGLSEGEYYGMVFQDSDVGKWIEAASYALMLSGNKALEEKIDSIVDIIGKAQQPDGYLNTYYTIKEPTMRWTNLLECHEMYCAGHLIEGAVAYYQATGKRAFMDVMCRMADHIDSIFGPEEGKRGGYPGHPELELALVKLYEATGEKRYLGLASFMIDSRGKEPRYFEWEALQSGFTTHFRTIRELSREYAQWHAPVREQPDAVGHAVRALYLYAGMAAVAKDTRDESLISACERLWDSAANRQRYITGAYGAQNEGEAFSKDYELPNDTVYGETCASAAMIFFSQNMFYLTGESKYADIIENALYNTLLAGTQLDGTRFFYVNPLEVVKGVSGQLAGYRSQLIERPRWFGCACCPPNLARVITALPRYASFEDESGIWINQFLSGDTYYDLMGGVKLLLKSNYPWDGELDFVIIPELDGIDFTLRIRIPGWCHSYSLSIDGQTANETIEKGYAVIKQKWHGSTLVRLMLDMPAERCYAHSCVRHDAGCVAIMRGPVVYCFEEKDNGSMLHELILPRKSAITVKDYNINDLGGIRRLSLEGFREHKQGDVLYDALPPVRVPVTLTAIPYYAWSNRGANDMRVWVREG